MTEKQKEQINTWEQALEKIKTVFTGPAVEPLESRVKTLFMLAKQTEDGAIVELGTHHGYGAFALTYGSQAGYKVDVVTVDEYTNKKGWAGEQYSSGDEKIFADNRQKLGFEEHPLLIKYDALQLADYWPGYLPVSLLYIDTGQSQKLISDITYAWLKHVAINGVIAFRDTTRRELGTNKITAQLISTGCYKHFYSDKYFVCVRKEQ